MYFLFETIKRDKSDFISSMRQRFSTVLLDGFYYLICEKYPQYFIYDYPLDAEGNSNQELPKEWRVKNLWEGFGNYPLVTFNREKYLKDKDPFEPFNPYNKEYFKKSIRRHIINDRVITEYLPFMEFKYLRKAVKYLIQGKLPPKDVIDDFILYNDKIESIIAKHPKTKDYLDKIDLKEYNGVKEKYDEERLRDIKDKEEKPVTDEGPTIPTDNVPTEPDKPV